MCQCTWMPFWCETFCTVLASHLLAGNEEQVASKNPQILKNMFMVLRRNKLGRYLVTIWP